MGRPPAVTRASHQTANDAKSLQSIARSFEARSKYHRNAAQDTFRWIIYTGLLGIVLAILVPPLTTLVDRYVRQEVTTEELVKLKERIAQIRTQLVQAYENYTEPSKTVKNLIAQHGSFFVRSSLSDKQDQSVVDIESKWIGDDKREYIVLRTKSSSVGEVEESILLHKVISLSSDGSELHTIREFSERQDEKIWGVKVNHRGIFLFVDTGVSNLEDIMNGKGERHIRFLPHDNKSNSFDVALDKRIGRDSFFRNFSSKIWGNDLVFFVQVRPPDSQENSVRTNLFSDVYLFESATGKTKKIVERIEGGDFYSDESFLTGNTLVLVPDSRFPARDLRNSDLTVVDLVTKRINKVKVPQKLKQGAIQISKVFPQGRTALFLFDQFFAKGDLTYRNSAFVSEFDPTTLSFSELIELKMQDTSDFLNVRQLNKKSEGNFSLMGSVARNAAGISRPVICEGGTETLKCKEYRYNKVGLDEPRPDRTQIGARFLDSIGQSTDFLGRTLLVQGGLSVGSALSTNRGSSQLVKLGNGSEIANGIVFWPVDVSLASIGLGTVGTDIIVQRYKSTLKNAELIEKVRTEDAVLVSLELSKALGATVPLLNNLRQVEHVPEALPILENADETSKSKLTADKEIKNAESAGTQLQQVVTRVAVLVIFAYLLHLLVVRQRIQQVLEEHNEARFHALVLLSGQKGRPSDANMEAKLLHELVAFQTLPCVFRQTHQHHRSLKLLMRSEALWKRPE